MAAAYLADLLVTPVLLRFLLRGRAGKENRAGPGVRD
jgi:hypothetical protein